jgi:hypothetical protein
MGYRAREMEHMRGWSKIQIPPNLVFLDVPLLLDTNHKKKTRVKAKLKTELPSTDVIH